MFTRFKKHYFPHTVHYCCSSMLRFSETRRFSQSSSFWEVRCALIGQLSGALWLAEYLKRVTEMLCPLPCCDAVSRRDETKTIKPTINEAFVAFSEDIINDYNDSYGLFTRCAAPIFFKVPCSENQVFDDVYLSMWCFNMLLDKPCAIVLSVIIRVCHCFAFTTVQWIRRHWLVWLSGGGANLHIHRSAYSKWGKGVELHSSYFKAWENNFHKKSHLNMSFWWSKISFKG